MAKRPKGIANLELIGDASLLHALHQLAGPAQERVVKLALKKSAKHFHAHVIQHLSGMPVAPKTGRYLMAMAGQRVGILPRRKYYAGAGFPMPTRAELGIDPQDESYYPASLEYGYTRNARAPVTVPAKAPIRTAVNTHIAEERMFLAREIGKGIEREARRLFRKGGRVLRRSSLLGGWMKPLNLPQTWTT